MSNLLPDYTSFNTFAATITNPQVLALYVRRSVIFGVGALLLIIGFGFIIAGSNTGKAVLGTAAQAGAAVATDGASLAATGVAKAAKGAKNAAG